MDKPNFFVSVQALLDFLKSEGWKISQRTLYRHIKSGLIRPGADGFFSMKEVNAYTKNHLVAEGCVQKEKIEGLHREKLKTENQLKQEELKFRRLKRLAAEGKLVSRDAVELELAARASVLDVSIRGGISIKAAELVGLVSGDETRVSDFIRTINGIIDQAINEFSKPIIFEVIFDPEPIQSGGL